MALLVILVLVIFAAVGAASFKDDFAIGKAANAFRTTSAEDFKGCENFAKVRLVRVLPRIDYRSLKEAHLVVDK